MPQSLAEESPPGLELIRWTGGESNDVAFLHTAAANGCHGVILSGRDSLEQPELHNATLRTGLALVAVDTDDPIEAKRRILANMSRLRKSLADHDRVLVLAREVRPYPSRLRQG